MRVKLQDRVAIVTGAGSGIGQGIARLYAREGARIAVVGRTERALDTVEAIRGAGGVAEWIPTDVSVSAQVQAMVARTRELLGPPSILVNNAAVQYEKRLWELPEDEFDRMLATNLRGYYLCAKYTIPTMIVQGGGCILNISSNLAFHGLPEFAGYACTKGGIVAMSRCLALECAPYGIRVNCICPGTTITPIMDPLLSRLENPEAALRQAAEATPVGRLGLPEDIAHLALYLVSDESAFVLGASYIIDGGASCKLG
jgi:NAD(P)-dependent dehydrogenase (short-subunit alcohol dehydrogenase family)